jgi:hypothetical protein
LPALTKAAGPATQAVPWQDVNSAFFEAIEVEHNDVPDPVADHPGGGAQHRVGPDHAVKDKSPDIAILRTIERRAAR